jgi:septum formation protein
MRDDSPVSHVILASQSPRRRELLRLVGIEHAVRPADIDESVLPGERPSPHAERLARTKAETLAAREPGAVVVAADTIVVVDGRILGKPADAADARATLRLLSGREHVVFTAVAVARGGRVESDVEEVTVTFRHLSDAEIAAYVATGEPMDKAGSYGIQGYGATIVERIDGDYFAVMGLSLVRLVRLLARVGIEYDFGRLRDAGESREAGVQRRQVPGARSS